jgi:hypothetical protein
VVGAGLGVALKRQGVLPDSWLLPGVASTALNVGINDRICKAIAQRAGGRFAYDTYARFLLYYGVIVHNKNPELYFDVLTNIVAKSGRDRLLVSDLQTVISEFKQIQDAPDDPFEQVLSVVKAIYFKVYHVTSSLTYLTRLVLSPLPSPSPHHQVALKFNDISHHPPSSNTSGTARRPLACEPTCWA